ncbi:hypothetical protein LTR99_007493 [Exophiala xenobiotica]|uniref:PHD-type domain-containing protein n=1 Tax=Vermiconidia calcicola TaxID=1690605 RepID=A0AAV9Q3N8_9PEZI|nr:hypothetical protein LTR99_007493 [Exophiala xenobiotica]KAK5429593.1 hypothetical protein LTR34_007189 [Exophiala xenobiotica]KAK5534602.1 hypothetical protein LTR25_006634 [Vermiconidia calcicola]KAK5561484.1 hypothetical protein LTR46_000289 [Exophiala xenobiotica]
MGPPETPNRLVQQSPRLFPSLQLSPDMMYAHQFAGPATAPAYPNQRVFWDPSSMVFDDPGLIPQQYQDHFQFSPVSMSTSFGSSTTVVPSFAPQGPFQIPEEQPYDLPMLQRSSSYTHLDASVFPAPFTTSPRILPPQAENPSMFLSSPARRFGAADQMPNRFIHNPVPERPAYAHQLEESRREQEIKRMRRSDTKQPSITRSVMEALRRPVSPRKENRPGLKRSLTHTGVRGDRTLKVQTSTANAKQNTPTQLDASRQHLPGRSSPLKQVADPISRTLTASRNSKRASLSLAIDENGVAKTIVSSHPYETDMDGLSSSEAESFDDTDFQIFHSQSNSFAFSDTGDLLGQGHQPYGHTKTNSHSTVASVNSAKQSSWHSSASNTRSSDGHARRKRPLATTQEMDIVMEDQPRGNAQHALRAIMEDRSRSTSAQGYHYNMLQLQSSPPLQQSQYATYGASPTTITDPELATPSTDRDSLASNISTRCVCNSSMLDGSVPMVQCDSCSKWLHTSCVGVDSRRIPQVYFCLFCVQTPVRQGATPMRPLAVYPTASPLAHKSSKRNR